MEYSEGIPIDKIIYNNFIKYTSLDKMFEKELSGICITEKVINVYIDLFSFLSDLYRNTNLQNIFHLTSAVVNMGIHYRNYFFKRGIYTNIIFIYSPNISKTNIKYINSWYQDYRIHMLNNPNSKNIIDKNLELLLTIMPYIPDMFIKIGSVSPSVMVFDIIRVFDSKGFRYPNVFVTRDPYAFQLPSLLPNTILFVKKYTRKGEDTSFSVNHNNCVNEFIRVFKRLQIEQFINPEWMTPYMILGGLGTKYGITSLFDYIKIFQILGQIQSQYSNYEPDSIYNAIQDLFPNTKVTFEDIDKRHKCLSLFYQLAEYSVLPESKEFNWLSQMKDFETLVRINEKYFKSAPMNLDKLG